MTYHDPIRQQANENLRRLYAEPPAAPVPPRMAALLTELSASGTTLAGAQSAAAAMATSHGADAGDAR